MKFISPSVHIHAARRAEVPVVVNLAKELACEEGHPDIIQATPQDWERDLFGQQAHFTAILADHDGETAGMLIYGKEFYPGWVAPAIKIHDLYVKPSHRRQHVAKALLEYVAGIALEAKAALVHLNVRAANPARDFYSRTGFQPVPECLTYLIALPAIQTLAQAASEIARLDLPGIS